MKKSYHSIVVPMMVANATRRSDAGLRRPCWTVLNVFPCCGDTSLCEFVVWRRTALVGVGVGDADVLGGGVFGDAFGAAFASEAGLFDAAEGCCGVGDDAGVEADHAEFDLFGDAQEPVEVAAVEVGGEPVLTGVGQPDGLFFGGEGGDGGDGAEDLLAQDRGVVGHVGEHRGLVEVPGPVQRGAAGDSYCSGVDGGAHEGVDVVAGADVDQGTDLGGRFGAAAGG